MCHNLQMTGHPTEGASFGEGRPGYCRSLGDRSAPGDGKSLSRLGLRSGRGSIERAADLSPAVLQLLESCSDQERFGQPGFPAVSVRGFLGWVLAELGKFEDGIIHGRKASASLKCSITPTGLANVCWALGLSPHHQGRIQPRRRPARTRAGAVSRVEPDLLFGASTRGAWATRTRSRGGVAEGIPLLEHALSANETMRLGAYQSLFLAYLGRGVRPRRPARGRSRIRRASPDPCPSRAVNAAARRGPSAPRRGHRPPRSPGGS